MLNFSSKPRLWTAVGVAVPLVIFFAARSVASWRPQRIGVQPIGYVGSEIRSELLTLSPDNEWLASCGDVDEDASLWNLSTRSKRRLNGDRIEFSADSHLVAIEKSDSTDYVSNVSVEVQLIQGTSSWKRKLNSDEYIVGFSGNKEVQTKTEHSRRFYDANNGKLLLTLPLEVSPWKEEERAGKSNIPHSIISYIPAGASKSRYSFETTNEYDGWTLSPDKQQLWVSLNHLNRFDILNAQTGKRIWFYTSKNVDSATFFCDPHWEDGGKSLATIEDDTLILRDARTGKVLLSHKNNLPAPLKSWAFTKDMGAVYLMDNRGEIFRQRLR